VSSYPVLLHTAIDAPDCRGLAEFYRQFLRLHYREGEEPPADGGPDGAEWLVLQGAPYRRFRTRVGGPSTDLTTGESSIGLSARICDTR